MQKSTNRTCIRQCRDESQIARCQEMTTYLAMPMGNLAGSLSLAGNEVRLKILLMLREEERLCVCDLAEILNMSIPAVSQHLKKMKEGGLLVTEQEGTTIYQRLSDTARPLLEALAPFVFEKIAA